jgi:hypothetical protein
MSDVEIMSTRRTAVTEPTCISVDHEDCFQAFVALRRRRFWEEVDSELPSQPLDVWPCIREMVSHYDARTPRTYRR